MSDKYAELRRLAEATYAEGEQWYDSSSIAALPGCICDERYVIKANPSTILSLLDELEECMKDDARYRWLRDNDQFSDESQYASVRYAAENYTGGMFDAAIDAAMQEQKP